MEKVKLTIDDKELEVNEGTTVLEAARLAGIEIPTLCFLKDVNCPSSCRVCVVEVGPKLIASCTLVATNGMNVKTNSPKVLKARKTVVELLLSNHKRECTTCPRSENCELQKLAKELNIRDISYTGEVAGGEIDSSSTSVVREPEKCILCGRCISTCSKVQTVNAIGWAQRGFSTKVATAYSMPLGDSICINCGQCINACPVGALHEKENMSDVWKALNDKDKYVIVQPAPAVRVALGEEFGLPVGTRVTGKMAAALKKLGFYKVFDTDFGADLTIMEEGTELINRLTTGENLPLMTSCCPGWVKFLEHNYPEMINNLSTCKSPHEMEGSIIKSYFAKIMNIDPSKIVVVSVMPCVAKKFEDTRKELSNDGMQDVDIVITTRELAQMIKEASIDFNNLKDEEFDNPFGESTGAAAIFGVTGGVAEAALRTVFEVLAGKELETIDYTEVRGTKGIKEATLKLPNGKDLRTAVAHGLGNARELLDMIKSGEKTYDFIEVMACPGGCLNGGGQPIKSSKTLSTTNIIEERAKAIYEEDKSLPLRKSHENKYIKKLYADYLEAPNSELSHKLLHTHYQARNRY